MFAEEELQTPGVVAGDGVAAGRAGGVARCVRFPLLLTFALSRVRGRATRAAQQKGRQAGRAAIAAAC